MITTFNSIFPQIRTLLLTQVDPLSFLSIHEVITAIILKSHVFVFEVVLAKTFIVQERQCFRFIHK